MFCFSLVAFFGPRYPDKMPMYEKLLTLCLGVLIGALLVSVDQAPVARLNKLS